MAARGTKTGAAETYYLLTNLLTYRVGIVANELTWRAATRPVAGRYAAGPLRGRAATRPGRYAACFQGRYAAHELT